MTATTKKQQTKTTKNYIHDIIVIFTAGNWEGQFEKERPELHNTITQEVVSYM